jgi:hypothetical protein
MKNMFQKLNMNTGKRFNPSPKGDGQSYALPSFSFTKKSNDKPAPLSVGKTQRFFGNHKAQVTLFVIIAIAIVSVIILFFVFKGESVQFTIPKDVEPVYSYYISCVSQEALIGLKILGKNAGYIELPDFFPGSDYLPFSSQLDFLGEGIPYWYYLSGNGLSKSQMPSKEKMELELNNFLSNRLKFCDFSSFQLKGYDISIGEPVVSSVILDNRVEINVLQDITIHSENNSFYYNNHQVRVDSNLLKYYSLAKKIYDYENQTNFLENYALDILRLYAPVDGTKIGCDSQVWFLKDIRENLSLALESNIAQIKLDGNYYDLKNYENRYFVQNIGEKVDVSVNFMYLKSWPSVVEAWPSEDGVLRADSIGLQQGLGMLGFCYTPYHYVYDFGFPVLVQLYSNDFVFQFPLVVYIDKNQARKALNVEGLPNVVPEVCLNKNKEIVIRTYDMNSNPLPATLSFKCFDTSCSIGSTSLNNENEALLFSKIPSCVNGYIIASAPSYETTRVLFSDLNLKEADIYLKKKYKLNVSITNEGSLIKDSAIISFKKDKYVETLVYPETSVIELSEGQYEISVYIYSNSSINVKGTTSEKCVDVLKTGFLGIFGSTEKKCFTFQIPDSNLESVVFGGGSQNYYISESELENYDSLIIESPRFNVPKTIEEVSLNYNNLESSSLEITFS